MTVGALSLASGHAEAAQLRSLTLRWAVRPTTRPIAARPVIRDHTVYLGAWDGYEYAFSEATGGLNWRSFMGRTTGDCDGTRLTQGVTSAPAFWSGVGYVGGGGPRWYAFDPASGRTRWRLWVGDNSPAGGHYNWSSPLIYRGSAYIGVASLCDSPLVQGKLLRVGLSSHRVDRVWKAVPDGQVGGGIWTNPVLDPVTNTVYVTTGNAQPGAGYGESIVGLDARTLAVRTHWTLPVRSWVKDSDWGTSPTLFSDVRGRALLAAANKNGLVYAFRRGDLGAGPVWRTRIAEGGPCGSCGDGSVSTGLFDGHRLYFAGGRTTIRGQVFRGSIRAINPATGRVIWAHGLPSPVFAALTGQRGMVVVAAGDGSLYVLAGATGRLLYENDLGSGIYAPPAIADGSLFIGTTDGAVHAFRFP